MKNPFIPLAAKLYKKYHCMRKKINYQKMYGELQQLYPLKDTERLYDDFQIRKLALILTILFIGTVSAVCLHLNSRTKASLAEGAQLVRNEWGAGDYKIILRAKAEEWSREMPFLVQERALTQREKQELQDNLKVRLPDIIKKDNQDLQHVTGNLDLAVSVPGYPFKLAWASDNTKRVSGRGEVNRKGIEGKGEWVTLTATVTYGQERIRLDFRALLLPETLNEEEGFFRMLENELAEREGGSGKEIFLPERLDGKEITWEEIRQDYSLLLILFSFLAMILVGKGMENDLERNCRKRNRQLLTDYPAFVSKLRLYLSAGLTVKSAFIKITEDYRSQKQQRHYLCEEMQIACYQLENGMMEEQVYQDWGKRCGEMRYRRLSFLLAVNLKQGNSRLLMLLAQEADAALEERRSMARKAGEEAGTRLLLPMTLMLVVVMFLVLLPAYMDFGSL